HLALTLERLDEHVRLAHGAGGAAAAGSAERRGGVQRIGLSATQNPLEEIGRFLVGPGRTVKIVDAGARKPLDLRIEVPVESMTEPGGPVDAGADPLAPVPGGEATRASIWPAIYPELLAAVRAHNSTIG